MFRGSIDDQYSSKYHTCFPRNSREILETMSKKHGKIRIFERLKNEGVSRDPDFMVNRIVKSSNIEELDPICRLLFFNCNIFDKKKILCVHQRHIYRTKKIVPLEKKFSPPITHKKICATNKPIR